MRHPDERQIVLYAGGDAGFMGRLSIGRHIAHCSSCSRMVQGYRDDRERIRREADQLPTGLDWDRLAAEITANVRVGLEAGECVGDTRAKSHHVPWRPVFAATAMAMLLISGWFLNFPSERRGTLARGISRIWSRPQRAATEAGVSLESTGSGIQISENGSSLTMMHSGSAAPVVVVSTRGSLRARYVDSDTGQVTITNVYAQ